MVSFNCIGPASSSFDGLQTAPFKVDDKILSRAGGRLTFATYDGTKLVGSLVNLVRVRVRVRVRLAGWVS